MSIYTSLNITVRRKNKEPITRSDVVAFESYFYYDLHRSGTFIHPKVCFDGQNLFASCEIVGLFDTPGMQSFAIKNPHLQIEVYELSDDCDIGNTRHLFEGELWEPCPEVTRYADPVTINWEEGTW